MTQSSSANPNGNGEFRQDEGESSNVHVISEPHMPMALNENNEDNTSNVLPTFSGENRNKKTLVLDLDETLVHTKFTPASTGYDFTIMIHGYQKQFYVLKGLGVDELLLSLGATGLYEIILFTIASRVYADVVVDRLLDSLSTIDSSNEHKNRNMNIIPPTH